MTKVVESSPSSPDELARELAAAGVHSVVGTVVTASGVTLAKTVPITRLAAFEQVGLGSSPVSHVFCIDAAIAWRGSISAVGDLRLRLDRAAVRNLGDGLAWAPTSFFDQEGAADPACARGLLARVERSLADAGLAALVGHEVEVVLVAEDGSALANPAWVPYGATGLLDQEPFLADVHRTAQQAGLQIEQLHAEYGRNQFELSLAPAPPVAAADAVVLAKLVLGRVARRHQMRASFSPLPFPGTVGSGAHQHFSLSRGDVPLFAGGDGPQGMTAEGGAALGALVTGLPGIQGLLTSSLLSGGRLAPGMWSGVHRCWGVENREAAVRFIGGGPANPYGANVEVKIIDPSANVYVASAAILGLALHGITSGAVLEPEVTVDPSKLSGEQRAAAGIDLLPSDQVAIIDALDASGLARSLVGDPVVDATVAVRRHEHATYGGRETEEIANLFRLAWTL